MRKLLPLKFFSWLILAAVLTALVHGACKSAHASQSGSAVSSEHAAQSEIFASQNCPCCPVEPADHHGACDSCINCICHATSLAGQVELTYLPVVIELQAFHPYKHLPEVFLSKFIPPQNLV